MPARRVIVDSRSPLAAAEPPQQIRRHPTFIEKPILAHVTQRLPEAPLASFSRHIRSPLFFSVDGFF